MSMIRHVPIRYDDFWRPMGGSSFHSSASSQGFPSTNWVSADFPTTSFSQAPAPLTTPMMMQTTPSSNFFPTQLQGSGSGDLEMRRMNEEMNRMFQNMQRQQPLGNVDDWRLTENFRMENPIMTERDGSRKFKLNFDVRQFKPEEINVRTNGHVLTVHAKHDEKDPAKSMFREFHRQFTIPKEVNPESLISKLTGDGQLSIEAPLPALEGPRDKMIPIEHNRV